MKRLKNKKLGTMIKEFIILHQMHFPVSMGHKEWKRLVKPFLKQRKDLEKEINNYGKIKK